MDTAKTQLASVTRVLGGTTIILSKPNIFLSTISDPRWRKDTARNQRQCECVSANAGNHSDKDVTYARCDNLEQGNING